MVTQYFGKVSKIRTMANSEKPFLIHFDEDGLSYTEHHCTLGGDGNR